MKNDCLFCKIAAGEIPSEKIFEDENTFAFLDIHPTNPGHTLVIPKEHFENLYEIPDKILSALFITTKKLAKAVKAGTKADGINIMMNNEPAAGQVIFHAHVHVIPRFQNDGLTLWPGKDYENGRAAEVAKQIAKNI
ncbi:MAG TPA: HIT family protein [Candidatus Paceibacterota bacterium]|nr:HIT family protein [Candidatus Paceibacterota bacterium]